MAEREQDISTAAYEATHKLLTEWAAEYWRITGETGETDASATTISRTLQAAQVFDEDEAPRETRRSRRECLDCHYRASVRRWGNYTASRVNGRRCWSSDACPKCRSTLYREAELSARGKETRNAGPVPLAIRSLSGEALRIEAAMKHLEPYMRDVIHREYRIRQRTDEASRELRVPKNVYRGWVRIAVAEFALVLADLGPSRIHSDACDP